MSFDTIYKDLKRDIIQAFALADEWFDRDTTLLQHLPAQGGWSAAQVLEHIVLTTRYLLIRIEEGKLKALQQPGYESRAELENYSLTQLSLEEIQDPTSFLWDLPAHRVPAGIPLTQVREEFRDQLDHCLCTLELLRHGEGVRYKMTPSVNNLGKVDVYQYLYFLALHIRRHLEQLRNIEAEVAGCAG
jgi:hypothetical protein